MNPFAATTGSALAALEIHPPAGFSWFGDRDEDEAAYRMDTRDARLYLLDRIQMRLYNDFYVHGAARPTPAHRWPPSDTGAAGAFGAQLRAANSTDASRQGGWILVEVTAWQFVVERDGLRLWVNADDVLRPSPANLGDAVTLRLPAEQLRISPGFYSVLGEQELPINADTRLTRVYWNIGARAAPRLIAALTDRLNRIGLGFRLKVCDRPEYYDRADAAVLYLPAGCWSQVEGVLREVSEDLGELDPAVPAYTKRLAPGVAVAEDDGAGMSFGTSRCELLAAAALAAAHAGAETLDDRVTVATGYFARHGVDPDRPHLQAGSEDPYQPWRPS